MLLEFLSKEQDKLKEKVEAEVPNIKKNDMTIQFHEERIIDLEEKNGYMIEVVFAILMIQNGRLLSMSLQAVWLTALNETHCYKTNR